MRAPGRGVSDRIVVVVPAALAAVAEFLVLGRSLIGLLADKTAPAEIRIETAPAAESRA